MRFYYNKTYRPPMGLSDVFQVYSSDDESSAPASDAKSPATDDESSASDDASDDESPAMKQEFEGEEQSIAVTGESRQPLNVCKLKLQFYCIEISSIESLSPIANQRLADSKNKPDTGKKTSVWK